MRDMRLCMRNGYELILFLSTKKLIIVKYRFNDCSW